MRDILNSNIFSTINEYNYNFSTDQIILKPIPPYDFELCASDNAFNMLINSSTIEKNIFQSVYQCFFHLS